MNDNANENVKNIKLPDNPYARATPFSPIVRVLNKVPRNTWCPLTLTKFKNCCGKSGQDYCTKAKENLENYLNELKSNNNDKTS
jgi:hypothetical protein